MKFYKKAMGALIVGAILSTGAIQAFAANTLEQAKNVALGYVPAESIILQAKEDYDKYEIKLYNQKDKTYYEIDVNKITQKAISFESESQYHIGSTQVTLNEEAAKNIVLKEIPQAQFTKVELDFDNGLQEYEISFYTTDALGKYKINPKSGMILEREIKFIDNIMVPQNPTVQNPVLTPVIQTPVVQSPTTQAPTTQAPAQSAMISVEQVKQIVSSQAPNATISKIELDNDDGRLIYEGEMKEGYLEYEFEVDAQTGAILKWDVEIDD